MKSIRSTPRTKPRAAILAPLVAAIAVMAAIAALSAAAPAAAKSASKLVAPTPYMGWDSSYAFGKRDDEATILEQASNLVTSGLRSAGYRLIWLDGGWWQGQRSKSGQIEVSNTQWPHGMAWLAATLHAEGFEVGLYTDAGINGCAGGGEGMYGHYQQDINTFARWGVDAVKVDFCGGDNMHLTPSGAYGRIHAAILHNASHRPMILEICDFPQPGQLSPGFPSFANSSFSSFSYGPLDGTSWRTDTDIGSMAGGEPWGSVVRNMEADATEPGAARPGHWNDPGYLGPGLGMSDAQFQTQFAMWAMLAAPLMVSVNLSTLSQTSLQTLLNPQLIAIDQDKLGRQGVQVPPTAVASVPASQAGEAWIKPLANGRYAVALLNLSSSALTISTSAQGAGIPAAASYTLTNAWTGATTTTGSAISASVPADSTAVFVVSPA